MRGIAETWKHVFFIDLIIYNQYDWFSIKQMITEILTNAPNQIKW